MSFADEYTSQMLDSAERLHDVLFPKDRMKEFDEASRADIEAGRNRCAMHPDRETMSRIWPMGGWMCDECYNAMWKTGGFPFGVMVFDMSGRPEGWKP